MNVFVYVWVSDGPLEERAFISSLLCIQNTLSGPHTALDSSHSQNTHTHAELIQQQVEWSSCCQTLDPREERKRDKRHYSMKPNVQSKTI